MWLFHGTILICHWRCHNTTQVIKYNLCCSRQISQSDCSIHIKLNYKNIIQIFHWNRGKIWRINAGSYPYIINDQNVLKENLSNWLKQSYRKKLINSIYARKLYWYTEYKIYLINSEWDAYFCFGLRMHTWWSCRENTDFFNFYQVDII